MANLSLTRVNQKLAQARILLNSDNTANLSPVHINALIEASAFHLVCAYQHYLREIAETYWLKNTFAIKTELDLVKAFETAKKFPAEASELVALKKEANSWLSQLHSYYDSLWQIPQLATTGDDELISLVDLEAGDLPPMSLDVVKIWQSAFVDLVQRQRETSAEF